MSERILVGGIGNIFLGDDAFGVEVERRLSAVNLSPEVRLRDFGIRGFDLTYALLEDYEHAILIDAVPRGGTPGTLYVIEPEISDPHAGEGTGPTLDMHNMDPVRVMRLVRLLGGHLRGVTVVGCEPGPVDDYDLESGLSPSVAAAVEPAVALVLRLIRERLSRPACHATTGISPSLHS